MTDLERIELACRRAATKIKDGKTGLENIDSYADVNRTGPADVALAIANELRDLMTEQ